MLEIRTASSCRGFVAGIRVLSALLAALVVLLVAAAQAEAAGSVGFDPAPGSPFGVGTQPISVAIGNLNGGHKARQRLLLNDNVNPDNKKLSILSKDPAIRIGGNGSSDDPTIIGLTVRVESASAGFDNTYTLPASGWDVIGQPGQNKGYRYKDSQHVLGPIKDALLPRVAH